MPPLQDPGVDVGDLIKKIINGLVVFVFIGLPIVKSILESRKQEKEKQRRASVETEAPPVEERARPTWEELLRGEVESPPAVPPPIPPSAQSPVSRVPSTGSLVDLESSAPPMLSEENLESEGASDEEAIAQEAIERREREELARQQEIVRRQREAASSMRESVEPVYTAGVDLAAARPAPALARAASRSRIPRTELARGVVMAEILGAPVGLDPLGERRASRPPAL